MATLLNFSQRSELSLHAELAADVSSALTALGIRGIVVGAFARDLHLHYGAGIPIQRATRDVDFAFMVASWAEFDALRNRLIKSGACRAVEGGLHRLRHRNEVAIDLVPFGSIEAGSRQIAWPPNGDMVMDVFGFREALVAATEVLLPGDIKIQIVSLPSLGLLKIVAWDDRHHRSPGKDAADLVLIIRNYLAVEANRERLWGEFNKWTQDDNFDYEQSGARMLGHDIRQLLNKQGLEKIAAILWPQIDERELGELPQEMDPRFPGHAQELLRNVYGELIAG
jgi:predicted nucleotidyltransferase